MMYPGPNDYQLRVAKTEQSAQRMAAKIQHAFNLHTFCVFYCVYLASGWTFDTALRNATQHYSDQLVDE